MRFVRDALDRMRRRDAAGAEPPDPAADLLADASASPADENPDGEPARVYWGATPVDPLPDTGVERRETVSQRVAALIAAAERPAPAPRPSANPAFSEALFVELLRAGQYRRAFDQLAPECQVRWGSPSAFAAAQEERLSATVLGVDVREVRILPAWSDPDAGQPYEEVAELEADYRLGDARCPTVVRRTVHLVPVDGRWRSLCYPGGAPSSSSS